MKVEQCEKYGGLCIVLDRRELDDADIDAVLEQVVEMAHESDAIFRDSHDDHFVVQFPGGQPELFSLETLDRALLLRKGTSHA